MGQKTFVLAGIGLFALKLVLDSILARAFGRRFSILFYVSPTDAPLLQPGGQLGYWLAMWALALPFIAAGVVLTAWRLRDAGMPAGLVVLFFVPFANLLFFLVCAVLPSRDDPAIEETWAGRERRTVAASWTAAACGAVVGLGTLALSVQALEQYGAALFIGAPFLFGFTSGITYARLVSPRFSGALAAAVVGLGISAAVMIEFAIEGIVCLLMSIPLAVPEAALGAWLGVLGARGSRRGARAAAGGALGLLPCLLVADVATPLPPAPTSPVETVRVIAAPAETVWERVVAFPEMDAPTGWLFRMGIAAPLGATIRGEGVGGVRECRFTTGSFVEPIEVWERGRELTFAVASQPDPMREWVLWEGPRPPHLTGFLQTTRGQFLLQELPDGGTRLIGRTWYRTNMVPEAYWRLFADAIIHAIHGRVLDHVARLAEADVRAGRASRG